MDLSTDIKLRTIKIIDICYLTVIYFLIGIFIAKLIDKIIGKFDKDKEEKKHITRILTETILFISFIGITLYVLRNIVEKIPFPLDGLYGFNHMRVKEINGGIVFVFSLLFFQKYLRDKLNYLFSIINF